VAARAGECHRILAIDGILIFAQAIEHGDGAVE